MSRVSKFSVLSLAVLFAMLVGLMPMGAMQTSAQYNDNTAAPAEVVSDAAVATLTNRTSGELGDLVTFSLAGFSQFDTIEINWNNNFTIKTVNANSSGAVSGSFWVPAEQYSGTYSIYFRGQIYAKAVNFTVLPEHGLYDGDLNVYTGACDTTLFSWYAFAMTDETVSVWVENESTLVEEQAVLSPSGKAAGSFILNCTDFTPGNYTIWIATGPSNSYDTLINKIEINLTASGFILLEENRGPAGSTVNFELVDWTPDAYVVCGIGDFYNDYDENWDDSRLIGLVIDPNGYQQASTNVPEDWPAGQTSFFCVSEGGINSVDFYVDNAAASIDPAFGLPTSIVNFSITGFMPFTNVSVSWDGDEEAIVVTDANGDGDGTITVPAAAAPGEYTINFTDGLSSVDEVYTVITPAASIGTNKGQPGSSVTFNLTDWVPNDTVSVRWDGVEKLVADTDNDGNGEGSLTIPMNAINGNHTISFTQNGFTRSKTFLVIRPSVTVSKLTASAGNTITYFIAKFPANSDVVVTFGGVQIGTALTDSDGEAYGSFVVPSWAQTSIPSGNNTYPVVWSSGQWSAKVIMTIGGTPKVTLSQNHGYQGQRISYTLTNFKANTWVTIRLSGITLAYVKVDANGYAKGTFRVPAVADGQYQIRVWDSKGYLGAITFYVI